MSETAMAPAEDKSTGGKITCQIDGALVHSIHRHLKEKYPDTDWTIEKYRQEFPDAPLLSKAAEKVIEQQRRKREQEAAKTEGVKAALVATTGAKPTKKPFHEVFELGEIKSAMNARGMPIPVTVMGDLDSEADAMVPDVDDNYVFNIELIKTCIMGFELNMPVYLWGYHGTGKTTVLEQVCARTQRPFMRVQHTVNTEEAHIVGQYIVKDGSTEFQLGPLAVAMLNGYVYCADEYDFAMPSVLSVYQPVLEGKPLVIKDAPPEMRVIRPHPDFRFCATGNTNGGGDETGLYQGTTIQNAANYSRFSIVEEVRYMDPKIEASVICGQAKIEKADAVKLVEFATEVREQFKASRISSTISPRELIAVATIAIARGSDWKSGLRLGFTNRLSRIDKETIEQYIQRVFG